MDNGGNTVGDVVERFQQALRAARAGAWEWRVGSSEAFWSDENYALLGLDPGSGVASFDAWLSCLHPDDRDAAKQAVQAAVENGDDLDIEFRVVLPDGKLRWLRDVGKLITDDTGNPVAMYGIQIDVTERTQAKLAQQNAEAQLRQAQRLEAVGTLAGGVAHDFNNLLTVILSASDTLRQRLDDAVEYPELDDIRDASNRATALTRQLLTFGRRQALKPRVLELNPLVEQLVPMIRRVIREDVELNLHLGSNLPRVMADPAQLDQVLMNLVINARDAMSDGGTLSIETRRGDGTAMLLVSDTGVGMDEETARRAFDPFYTTKGPSRGSGLGLATVYGIVTQSGGNVEIRSTPGQGATFTVTLPATDEPPSHDRSRDMQEAAKRKGAVVLLVEDDGAVRRVTEQALINGGYRVLAAGDADEAMRIVREYEKPIDLVLTDVVMPGASGVELTERLLTERPGLRVLFMSGYTGEVLTRRGLGKSAPLLEKPFSLDTLLEGVNKVLS